MRDANWDQELHKAIVAFLVVMALIGLLGTTTCSVSKTKSPVVTGPRGDHVVQIDHVYDGDTFYFKMPGAWPEISMTGVRVLGIDAPEVKGRCDAERIKAREARTAAQSFLSRGSVTLRDVKYDKYGGRIEASVWVDGESLASYMLSQGLARPYHGEHRDKLEWCS